MNKTCGAKYPDDVYICFLDKGHIGHHDNPKRGLWDDTGKTHVYGCFLASHCVCKGIVESICNDIEKQGK